MIIELRLLVLVLAYKKSVSVEYPIPVKSTHFHFQFTINVQLAKTLSERHVVGKFGQWNVDDKIDSDGDVALRVLKQSDF